MTRVIACPIGFFVAASLATSMVVATRVDAQRVLPSVADTVDDASSGAGSRGVITRRQLLLAGAAVATTLAIAPFDRRSAAFLQLPRFQRQDDLQRTASDAAFMGGPGPFALGAVLFACGRVTGDRPFADVGIHLTEGVLLAGSITALAKGVSGRALPNAGPEAGEFELGRGFHHANGPFVSFPSGHTAAAFAMAAVFTSEARHWRSGAAAFVGPVTYGGATIIGLARMYQNVHWASDLPIAAAIGAWAGTAVVRHQHQHPENRLDQWLLGASVAPTAGHGLAVAWSRAL